MDSHLSGAAQYPDTDFFFENPANPHLPRTQFIQAGSLASFCPIS